jgi:hypothetical protein
MSNKGITNISVGYRAVLGKRGHREENIQGENKTTNSVSDNTALSL